MDSVQTRGRPCLNTLITDVLCPHRGKNKGNLDKDRVLKAISRDKQ